MKITCHVPVEQYGFVEFEFEPNPEVGPQDEQALAARMYAAISEAFKPKPLNELPAKDFNAFLDAQLLGEPNHIEQYEKLSPKQIDIVQAVKRALKRLESKNNPPELRIREQE